jgi:hypothetical protein
VSLFLPQINKLQEDSIVWGEDASSVATIPTQNRMTHQILSMCQHFKDLKQIFVVSHRTEHRHSRVHQCVVTTVEDSVLHTEMTSLESHEEDAPRRVFRYKPKSWLEQIRPHHRDESWSVSL